VDDSGLETPQVGELFPVCGCRVLGVAGVVASGICEKTVWRRFDNSSRQSAFRNGCSVGIADQGDGANRNFRDPDFRPGDLYPPTGDLFTTIYSL